MFRLFKRQDEVTSVFEATHKTSEFQPSEDFGDLPLSGYEDFADVEVSYPSIASPVQSPDAPAHTTVQEKQAPSQTICTTPSVPLRARRIPHIPNEVKANPEVSWAGQRYLETYGDPLVTNTYLKVAVLFCCFTILVLAFVIQKQHTAIAHTPTRFIRINEVGRAEPIDYQNLAYKPQESENKYYLMRWTQLHFQRNRYAIERDQTENLYFEDSSTGQADIAQERQSKFIEQYKTHLDLPFVEVAVTNIILSDLSSGPYTAQIEFLKIFREPMTNAEIKRERWTTTVNYTFRTDIPENMISVNPVGLTIVHFRIDQAFTADSLTAPTVVSGSSSGAR